MGMYDGLRNRFNEARNKRGVNFENLFWSDVSKYLYNDLGSVNSNSKTITFPQDTLPNQNTLWNAYNNLAQKRGVKADYIKFIQNYDTLKIEEDKKYFNLANKATEFGMKDKDIRKEIKRDPVAERRLNSLYDKSDITTKPGIMKYLKDEKGMFQKVSDFVDGQSDLTKGVGAIAAGVGTYKAMPFLANKAKNLFSGGESKDSKKSKGSKKPKAKFKMLEQTNKVKNIKTSALSLANARHNYLATTSPANAEYKSYSYPKVTGVPEYIDKTKLNKFKDNLYLKEKKAFEAANKGKTFTDKVKWSKGKDVKYLLEGMKPEEIKKLASEEFSNVTKKVKTPIKDSKFTKFRQKLSKKGKKGAKIAAAGYVLKKGLDMFGSDKD